MAISKVHGARWPWQRVRLVLDGGVGRRGAPLFPGSRACLLSRAGLLCSSAWLPLTGVLQERSGKITPSEGLGPPLEPGCIERRTQPELWRSEAEQWGLSQGRPSHVQAGRSTVTQLGKVTSGKASRAPVALEICPRFQPKLSH